MTRDHHVETDGTRYVSTVDAIVRTVAVVRNEEISDVDPLYEAIDPEALERLLDTPRDVTVRFEYAGHTVTVDSSGIVRIDETIDSTNADPTTD